MVRNRVGIRIFGLDAKMQGSSWPKSTHKTLTLIPNPNPNPNPNLHLDPNPCTTSKPFRPKVGPDFDLTFVLKLNRNHTPNPNPILSQT